MASSRISINYLFLFEESLLDIFETNLYHVITMCLLTLVCIICIFKQSNAVIYQCNPSDSCRCSTSSTVLARIIVGENAVQGSWSWAISLPYYGSHICGGSVLSPIFILTAAHCIEQITNLARLSVGSVTLHIPSSNTFNQMRSIARICKHPNYDASTYSNDLTLLCSSFRYV